VIVELIDQKRFRAMPWANGRGVTTELYVHKDARTGRMLWRLSIAGVDSDGPFSHFAGYDRVLVLLEGAGLTLSHGDGTVDRLSRVYEIATFPGDVATQAALTDGPIKDFNLIADRASYKTAVNVVPPETTSVQVNADHLAIFAVDGGLFVLDPASAKHKVPQGDLLLVDSAAAGEWVFSGATAIVIQLLTRI
jgi:environmental stress-induced protein Ves